MAEELEFVVRIVGGDSGGEPQPLGTGFLLAPDRVLTCRHVVQEPPYQPPSGVFYQQLWVQRGALPPQPVRETPRVPPVSVALDLALLTLVAPLADPGEVPPLLWGLTQAQEEALRQSALVVYGYPQQAPGDAPRFFTPHWLMGEYQPKPGTRLLFEIQLIGAPKAGCSGGPLLLALGRHWTYAGLAYLGGQQAGHSRYIMADQILEWLQHLDQPLPRRLDAPRALQLARGHPALAERLWREAVTQPFPDTGELPNPYRGLAAFREVDAAYYYGRQAAATELLEAVQDHALVAVLGASGSGKSSLVFAGLWPVLRQAGTWRLLAFRPGKDLFANLATALVHELYTDPKERADRLDEYARDLASGQTQLNRLFQVLLPERLGQRLLLVIDQFEELYTQGLATADQRRFLDQLLAVIKAQTIPPQATVLLTLRADFMGQVLAYDPLAEALRARRYYQQILTAMDEAAVTTAIADPAEQLGVTLETGLTGRILHDLGQEPGYLPLLEFALTELWQRRCHQQLTHAAYDAIGGVQGALTGYADRQFQALLKQGEEQRQLRRVFVQLVRPGEGTEDTRQVATREQVGEANWGLVQKLADARLVVTGRPGLEPGSSQSDNLTLVKASPHAETVELVHEALIQHWQPLQRWIGQDRQFRTWQNRLRQALQEWEEKQRDDGALLRGARLAEAEERLQDHAEALSPTEHTYIAASLAQRDREAKARRRRTHTTIASLTTGLLITLGLLLWVNVARQEASQQRVFAEQQRNVAQAREHEAKQAQKLALARQLAAQATLALTSPPTDLVKGALLATESLKRAQTHSGRITGLGASDGTVAPPRRASEA